jgi:hypothetical protein
MIDLFQAKEQPVADTPLLLIDCTYSNGDLVEHWSTHACTVAGVNYLPRVLKQNFFEMQLASDMGVDAIPKITLELANADSRFSEIERAVGTKGAQIVVSIVFYSFASGSASSSSQVLFKGSLNAPELITEELFRVSATNRLSLQRTLLPSIRIQKRCPWYFPATPEQRLEAIDGGANGKYSRFFQCGYSADQPNGLGSLNASEAVYESCSYTRSDCTARGMFNIDGQSRSTARFGGIEFVPPTISVRSAGEKGSHYSPVNTNEARYNDFVPMIYGTAWFNPSVVFSRNDGNLTHFEVLLGIGEIQGVQKVLVNQIEIPIGQSGRNMTGTGWYNVVSNGTRNGGFNLDFTDGHGNPIGDPYGSMAFLSIVVPNRINDGSNLPDIEVLIDGVRVPVYAPDGTSLGESFSNNPAWVILDLLRRIGWADAEIDRQSFATAAAYCAEPIQTLDLFGNPVTTPRFQTNLVLKNRRTAADVIRGIRNSARMLLRYGRTGLLELFVENSIALQQPDPLPSSNAQYSLNGGWPAYEFGDGTLGTTSIARTSSGASSVRIFCRSTADTPNRFSVEFQDAFNDYQQDSLSFLDASDIANTGQEITGSLPVLGLPHYDQAARILQFFLAKSVKGNTFIEFQTSIKALGLIPGDIISIVYVKEGFVDRTPFRVLKIQPGPNYRTAIVSAHLHDDRWYYDTNGQTSADASRRQGQIGVGLPKPLSGVTPDANGELQFGVSESSSQTPDGAATVTATVGFSAPMPVLHTAPAIPLISLIASISEDGGTLSGGQTLYYAISSLGGDGSESSLSFVVPATIPEESGSNTNAVTLTGFSFPPQATAFNVYRGPNPSAMNLIAGALPISSTYKDSGVPSTVVLPPDANYDHANFYWRLEIHPPVNATEFDSIRIGSSILELPPNRYIGMVARIISGQGAGQERSILGYTSTTITVGTPWSILPDSSSVFVISQPAFQFGATTKASPVQFAIPNQAGNVVQISGRSANCNGLETPYEVSPLTRWTIGGAGIMNVDKDVAGKPLFGIQVPDNEGGALVLNQIGFSDLTNTSTVTAATYRLHYLDETDSTPRPVLSAGLGATDTSLSLSSAISNDTPAFLLINSEILKVEQADSSGLQYTVGRGEHSSIPAIHAPGTAVYPLSQERVIVPFAKNFFGTPGAGDWSYRLALPNARIVSAELFVTNSQGDSPTAMNCYTGLQDGGWRTLSGGQLSFQVSGYLSVQSGAAPDIVVDAPKVVRDVFASVRQPPTGSPIVLTLKLNGEPYCTLSIPDGAQTTAQVLNGAALPPMKYKDKISLDVNSVGRVLPGSDLTVTIRV